VNGAERLSFGNGKQSPSSIAQIDDGWHIILTSKNATRRTATKTNKAIRRLDQTEGLKEPDRQIFRSQNLANRINQKADRNRFKIVDSNNQFSETTPAPLLKTRLRSSLCAFPKLFPLPDLDNPSRIPHHNTNAL